MYVIEIIVPGIEDNALLGLVLLLKEGNGSVDNNYMKQTSGWQNQESYGGWQSLFQVDHGVTNNVIDTGT